MSLVFSDWSTPMGSRSDWSTPKIGVDQSKGNVNGVDQSEGESRTVNKNSEWRAEPRALAPPLLFRPVEWRVLAHDTYGQYASIHFIICNLIQHYKSQIKIVCFLVFFLARLNVCFCCYSWVFFVLSVHMPTHYPRSYIPLIPLPLFLCVCVFDDAAAVCFFLVRLNVCFCCC